MMIIIVERNEIMPSNDENANPCYTFVIRQKTRGIVIFMVQKS